MKTKHQNRAKDFETGIAARRPDGFVLREQSCRSWGLAVVAIAWIAAVGIGAAGCIGSEGTYSLAQAPPAYTSFYEPMRRSIAVLPFENYSEDPGAAERLRTRIESALARSRAYDVHERANQQALRQEADLVAGGRVTNEAPAGIGQLASVDYVVTGSLSRYTAETMESQRTRRISHYEKDVLGKRKLVDVERVPYDLITHEALIECSISVIDTRTGQKVATFHQPVRRVSRGSPPPQHPEGLLRQAEDELTTTIVRQLIPTTSMAY